MIRGKGFEVGLVCMVVAAALVTVTSTPALARSGNYLIIVAESLQNAPALTQFKNHRTAEGFNVMLWTAPTGSSTADIKAYIQSLWPTEYAPDYILLVGDTPAIPHWTGVGSRHADSDLYYACMGAGDDWYPEIFIGRFAVDTEAELQAVVDKTIAVETGAFADPDYVKRAAFLATDDSTAQARMNHEWVINNYMVHANYNSTLIDAAQGGGTSEITQAVNLGQMFLVYFGHSDSGGWWSPSFDQGDVNGLTNDGLYGLVMGWSCNTAHFSYNECFGETWIRRANAGAAAYLSASNYVWWGSVSNWESSRRMERYFFESFFVDDIWEVGPAWQAALWRILADPDFGPTHDHTRNIFEEMVLLGDPALLIPKGVGFGMEVTPLSVDLCSPPTVQQQFTVEVTDAGGFGEAVSLSVNNVPSGATASFDINDLVPPFTATLTLDNLDLVPTGDYDMDVVGTAVTVERTKTVHVGIANGAPAAVVLIGPDDGSSGVPLNPTLSWQSVATASSYDVELATDPAFANLVYSGTVDDTSVLIETPLGSLTPYFWHVRASNACGAGSWSAVWDFTTVNQVMPAYYNMLNGETGTYSYYDDLYNGNGNNGVSLDPLSDGLGDLTDGVDATVHWNQDNVPYVGWNSIEPTITFYFDQEVNIDVVTLNVDDSGGGGGVVPPSHVVLDMGGVQHTETVIDPTGSEPFDITCTGLGMSGTSIAITLEDSGFTSSRYMMLAEVRFFGGPSTGACCEGGSCSITTEAACLAAGGVYQGDDTVCDPNPCPVLEPDCLIITEVVDGVLSGSCPRFIEITNTGLNDYTFSEGGLIIQTDASNDVFVDVDLTGYTVPSGQTFVINSNDYGACTGAFQAFFGFNADVNTQMTFGDGDDRYILTDKADGSNLLDIYGQFGVQGGVWDYEDGYSYRESMYNAGNDGVFAADEWFFGGKNSLEGSNPEYLLTLLTHPGTHTFDEFCHTPGDLDGDADADLDDFDLLLGCLAGPDVYQVPAECNPQLFDLADQDGDADVDMVDFDIFSAVFTGS